MGVNRSGGRPPFDPVGDGARSDRPRHVWALLGNSVEPVVYGLMALDPDSVTFIATSGSAPLVGTVMEQVQSSWPRSPQRSSKVLRVSPDQPYEIRQVLQRSIGDGLTRGDLLYGGGTTVMNVVTSQVWADFHAGVPDDGLRYRQWYLPARGTKLLSSDGSSEDLRDAFPSIEGLVAGAAPARSTWRPRMVDHLSFPSSGAASSGWSGDSRVNAATALAVALLGGEPDQFWSDASLQGVLGDHFDDVEWRPRRQQLTGAKLAAWRRGFALEVVLFALTARFVGARFEQPPAPAPSSSEVAHSLAVETHWTNRKGRAGSRDVFELDVVVRSGPRFTVLSCGVEGGTGDSTFARKRFEADARARQLGGSEARSALVWWRSPATANANRTAGWNLPADDKKSSEKNKEMLQRRKNQAAGNSTMVALGQFFPDWSEDKVRGVLDDPATRLPRGPARAVIEGCVFP